MVKGYLFLLQLHNSIYPTQLIGSKYIFIKWVGEGGLQFEINKSQTISA